MFCEKEAFVFVKRGLFVSTKSTNPCLPSQPIQAEVGGMFLLLVDFFCLSNDYFINNILMPFLVKWVTEIHLPLLPERHSNNTASVILL